MLEGLVESSGSGEVLILFSWVYRWYAMDFLLMVTISPSYEVSKEHEESVNV